jgi:hypothetical protein
VKRARELIYTAERQASRDVSLAGLRLKPGSSQRKSYRWRALEAIYYSLRYVKRYK